MEESSRAAFVFSQSVAALIRLEAMKAENYRREYQGDAPAYGEKEFDELTNEYVIGSNDVTGILNE